MILSGKRDGLPMDQGLALAGALAEQSIYDFAPLQYGEPVPLSKYKGKVNACCHT